MKKGSILLESVVFLLLSFLLFLLVMNAIDGMWHRQRIIEMNSQDLAFLISTSNVLSVLGANIPIDMKKELIVFRGTNGGILYEYTCKSDGKKLFLQFRHDFGADTGITRDLHDRVVDSF